MRQWALGVLCYWWNNKLYAETNTTLYVNQLELKKKVVEDIKSNLTVVVDEKSDIFHRTGVCNDYEQNKAEKENERSWKRICG